MQNHKAKLIWLPDRFFMKEVMAMALPMSLQFFIQSAVNLLDVIMIGRLGDAPVAATSAANQISFIMMLVVFGVNSGSSVFLSQFWGTHDLRNVHRTMGAMAMPILISSALIAFASIIAPSFLVQIYVHETDTITLGIDYLRIVSLSFVPTAASLMLATVCRCTGNVRLPMIASIISMLVNAIGNAILIFGLLGAPALGVEGAAIATVIARIVELLVLLFVIYSKKMPAAVSFKELFGQLDKNFLKSYYKTALPVIVNESAWSVGVSLYTVAYGMVGTTALAAVQIVNTVKQLCQVFVKGASNAAGIMIGRCVGADDYEGAVRSSRRFIFIMFILGLVFCGTMIVLTEPFLSFYNVSQQTLEYARVLMIIQAVALIFQAQTLLMIVGTLRSGGDTVYAAMMDLIPLWLIAVPLTFLAVSLGWPLWAVNFCVTSEEIGKFCLAFPRVLSNKWIKNVVKHLQ